MASSGSSSNGSSSSKSSTSGNKNSSSQSSSSLLGSAFTNNLGGVFGLNSGSTSIAIPAGGGNDPYIYKPGNGMKESNYSPESGSSLLNQLDKQLNASQERMLEQSRQAVKEATEKAGFEQRRTMDAQAANKPGMRMEEAFGPNGPRSTFSTAMESKTVNDHVSNMSSLETQRANKETDKVIALTQMGIQRVLGEQQENRLREESIANRAFQKEIAAMNTAREKELMSLQSTLDGQKRREEHQLNLTMYDTQSRRDMEKEAKRLAIEASERQKDREAQEKQMMTQGMISMFANTGGGNTRYW